MATRRKRRRNPAKDHSGLGAFLGSMAGAMPGGAFRSAPLAWLGSAAGAAVGGYVGAKDDRKKRGAVGGAVGAAILGPIGAAIGGYVAGKKPDAKKKNPGWVAPVIVVGALAAVGTTATVLVVRAKRRRALSEPEKPTDEPDIVLPEENDWGTGMEPSTRTLIAGVPVRLFKDSDGRWHFAYSWRLRPEGEGSGSLWDWLRAEERYKTILVLTDEDKSIEAYKRAVDHLEDLRSFVDGVAVYTDMRPGKVTARVGGYSYNELDPYRWGVVALSPDPDPTLPDEIRVIPQDPAWPLPGKSESWFYSMSLGKGNYVSGCCFDLNTASAELDKLL